MRKGRSIAVLLLPACLGACAGYATWPPIDPRYADTDQINSDPAPGVIAAALRHAARADIGAVHDNAAVALPVGADDETYRTVARRVGPWCVPATADNVDLPTYHVTRVIVRNVTAEVDILRPVLGLRGTSDQARYQGVTVHLSGGLTGWRVDAQTVYPVGMIEVPAPPTPPARGGR